MGAKWEKIAQAKMDSGEWSPVPWVNEDWYTVREAENQHFTHISSRDPSHVAYIVDYDEDADKMKIISGKPGRYLSKFFADVLMESQIRRYATKMAIKAGHIEVKFASEPDDIQKVYEEGPRSCMSRGARGYKARIHPCRIYGAGDLSVAYMENKSGGIISRTVCWPKEQVFSSIYGDGGEYDGVLREHLKTELGWEQDSEGLDGARCLKIPHEQGYVAPYLDGMLGFDIGTEHLIIRNNDYAQHRAGSENGVIGNLCCSCGEEMEDECEFNGDSYCGNCWSEVAFNCNECGDVGDRDDGHYIEDGWGSLICERCYDRYFGSCADCGDSVRSDELMEAPNGYDYCDNCVSNHVADCDECMSEVSPKDLTYSARDMLNRCETCQSELEEKYSDCEICGDEVENIDLSKGVCSTCEESLEMVANG